MPLYINILPASVDDPGAPVWSHCRDQELEERLGARPDRGVRFQLYRWRSRLYVWPMTSAGLPEDLGIDRWERHAIADLPARVVAYAVRTGAVQHLVSLGFEHLPGRPEAPARLYRRRINLAKKVVATIKDEVGMFPLVAVQDFVLSEEEDVPGCVGLIVDVRVINRLDLPLPEVAALGMEVMGMKVRWRHSAMCTCGPTPGRGTAGKVRSVNIPDTVDVITSDGPVTAPAECLVPVANPWMIRDYLRRVVAGGAQDVESRLRAAISDFRSNDEQWKSLNTFARTALAAFTVFGTAVAHIGQPMTVAEGATGSGSEWPGPMRLPPASEPKLNFRYGAPAVAAAPADGLRRYGPYDENASRIEDVTAVIMTPKEFEKEARRLARALETRIERLPGFEERFHLRSFKAVIHTFAGTAAPDYKAAAAAVAASGPDLVFLVISRQDRYAPEGRDPYRVAKAVLVARDIAAQAVVRENLLLPDSSLQWIVSNITLAAYAKIGNVPYVLHDPAGARELVLGVGRADIFDAVSGRSRQLFGAAVAFRQDGDFLFAGSTMPVADHGSYEHVLSALISDAADRYERDLAQRLDRITIHVFKRTGLREVRAAERALRDRGAAFALVHVNRDSPLWLMDERPDGRMTSPAPGTVVALHPEDRLVVTGEPGDRAMLHPVRLTLDRSSTFRDMDRIVDQAYGFTATSWRTFRRTQEPSSILYGRLLAQKVGHLITYGLDPGLIAAGLGTKPWFL